jgi:hypothetical protein
MRPLRVLLRIGPAVVLFIVLAIFVVENIRTERYAFLGNTITGNVWWIVTAAALLGFVAAAALLVPGRVAVGWRSRRMGREAGRREQDLTTVRAQNAQHVAELSQVTAERDHARDQQPIPVPVNAEGAHLPTVIGDVTQLSADERAPRHPADAFQSRLHHLFGPPEPPATGGILPGAERSLTRAAETLDEEAYTGKQTPAAHV